MKITSPHFADNKMIPSRFTCDGDNINPELRIEDSPAEARELVLIVDDPDSIAHLWTHWTVWGIDPSTKVINDNALPEGAIEGKTSFESIGYGGPCPSDGEHRYFFKLYALSEKLSLDRGAGIEKLEQEMADKIIASAELVGLYERKK